MVYTNATAIPRDELTDVIMEAAGNDEMFLGLDIFPEAPMEQTTGHVPKIKVGEGDLMRAARKRRTPGTHFDRWQSSISDYSITLVQVGEEALIPDEVQMTYEAYFDLESIYTKEAGMRLRRGVEIDHSTVLFDPAVLTATNSTVAYTFANLATMDPVGDIISAIRRIKAQGEMPNTIAIPGTVYDRIRQSTSMKSFIAGSINPGAIVNSNTMQKAFEDMGIKQVLILDSYVNNSDAGNADLIEPIWPNTYIFVGSVIPGALRAGGIGRTFFWEKEGPLFNVTSYRDETRKSNVIRAQKTAFPFITNARAGQLITTQYS
jgi:hypothetical protein